MTQCPFLEVLAISNITINGILHLHGVGWIYNFIATTCIMALAKNLNYFMSQLATFVLRIQKSLYNNKMIFILFLNYSNG